MMQDRGALGSAFYRDLLADVAAMIGVPTIEPQTSTIWLGLSSGTTTAMATTQYIEVPIAFPCLITGWRLLSRDNGPIVLSLRRATFDEYPAFTSITAAAPPTLVSRKAFSDTVPGWTTQINADDVLAVGITSNAGGLTTISLGLRVVRLGAGKGSV